ncbi:hypothetical protein ACIQNG_06290 [Streptomyces sp. NPDC091377]|uniref:hypothetical protein n=1 Tax=Streptomyces sp. NPDC091377 TaxID=3365995 RepID=UPI003828D729
MREALGDGYAEGMDCGELGSAIQKVTVGSAPGEHSLRQAQAMKDVLLAVEDSLGDTEGRLDPGLREPLAVALADYAADTHMVLGIENTEYTRKGSPSEPAWKDADGVHLAVSRDSLLRTVRAVSADPSAYVTVRTAATRTAAEELAEIRQGTTGDELTAPPVWNAHVLGSLDAIAADVRRDLGGGEATAWSRAVFTGLTDGTPESPPTYSEDPVAHLVDSWRELLRTADPADDPDFIEKENVVVIDVWGTALELGETTTKAIARDGLGSAHDAGTYVLKTLD